MKYRNIKTGAIVEVNAVVSGDWEPVEDKKPTSKKTTKAPKKKED